MKSLGVRYWTVTGRCTPSCRTKLELHSIRPYEVEASFEHRFDRTTRFGQSRHYQGWSPSSVASWPRVGVGDTFSFNLTEVACRWWPPLSNIKAATSRFGGLALRDKMARMKVSNMGLNYRRRSWWRLTASYATSNAAYSFAPFQSPPTCHIVAFVGMSSGRNHNFAISQATWTPRTGIKALGDLGKYKRPPSDRPLPSTVIFITTFIAKLQFMGPANTCL
jgi:hypothetical protein